MISRLAIALFGACISLPAAADYKSVHVAVEGGGGKGIAVSRGIDCFVITAFHVVKDPLPITVIGASRRTSTAEVHWRNIERDVGVLKVTRGDQICGPDYYLTGDPRPSAGSVGEFRIRDEDGIERKVPLAFVPLEGVTPLRTRLVGFDEFDVFPGDRNAVFGKGDSGAFIYLNGEPAGMLTSVATLGPLRGTAVRIGAIAKMLENVAPLTRPTEDKFAVNDQLSLDLLSKNVSYLATPEFCSNLWKLGKQVAKWEDTVVYSAKRRSNNGGTEYEVKSLLIPAVVTTLQFDRTNEKNNRSATTRIGRLPQSSNFNEVWTLAEKSIDNCVESRPPIEDVRRRHRLERDSTSKRTEWDVERTGWAGVAMQTATIWLEFKYDSIELSVWHND